MKKIILSIFACASLVFGLSSCNDTMDDKADVEAGWSHAAAPATTLTVSGTTFSSTTAAITVSDTTDVLEYGVQYSTSQDFADSKYAKAASLDPSNEVEVSGLAEQTTYYLRTYAVTRSNGTILGEDVKTIKTAKAPIFTIEGSYSSADFAMNDDGTFSQDGDPYDVEIAFV